MNKNSRYITGGERGLAWTSLYTSVPMSPGSNRRRARIRSKQIISPLPVLSSYLQGFFSGGGGFLFVCFFTCTALAIRRCLIHFFRWRVREIYLHIIVHPKNTNDRITLGLSGYPVVVFLHYCANYILTRL